MPNPQMRPEYPQGNPNIHQRNESNIKPAQDSMVEDESIIALSAFKMLETLSNPSQSAFTEVNKTNMTRKKDDFA